jgi:Icc protein
MAKSNAQRAVVLLQVTDTHLHAALDSRMRGVTTQETFLSVLKHVQGDRRWPPDGILATGDIVQDESRAGYERFRDTLGSFGVPVYCLPGNHDDPALMAKLLTQPPFQLLGEARLESWTLLLLNTFLRGEDAGNLGREQLAALEESLSAHRDRHVLIAMHHQPVPMGSAWLDGVGLRDAEEFLATVDRHPQVRGVLWGHVHQEFDQRRGEVRYMSTPSTCSQFLPDSEYFALDDRPPGLRWLALTPDGEIETEVDWAEEAEFA